MPSVTFVQQRLWLAAEHRAAIYGFPIASPCEFHLRGFIDAGVNEIDNEGHLSDAVWIDLADANIIAFVTRMVIAAQHQGLSELHEPTFHEAVKYLCPLWPFC